MAFSFASLQSKTRSANFLPPTPSFSKLSSPSIASKFPSRPILFDVDEPAPQEEAPSLDTRSNEMDPDSQSEVACYSPGGIGEFKEETHDAPISDVPWLKTRELQIAQEIDPAPESQQPEGKMKAASNNSSASIKRKAPVVDEASTKKLECNEYALYRYNVKLLQSEYDHEANLTMCTEKILEIQTWLDQFQEALKAKYTASIDTLFNEVFAQLDSTCQDYMTKLQESGLLSEQNQACRNILEKSKNMFSNFQASE